MSRRYEIEWPQTDELKLLVREWWTLEGEDSEEWIKRPLVQILAGPEEIRQWVKDNWEVEL